MTLNLEGGEDCTGRSGIGECFRLREVLLGRMKGIGRSEKQNQGANGRGCGGKSGGVRPSLKGSVMPGVRGTSNAL